MLRPGVAYLVHSNSLTVYDSLKAKFHIVLNLADYVMFFIWIQVTLSYVYIH